MYCFYYEFSVFVKITNYVEYIKAFVKRRRVVMSKLRDEATDLFNRVFFDEELERLSKVRGVNVGIIVCDVEMSGNPDSSVDVTVEFSKILKNSFRESDVLAKLGPNEFGIIIDDATEDILVKAIERLLRKVEFYNSNHPDYKIGVYANWSMSENFYGDARKAFDDANSKRKNK
jgi:GGDEF domain-containing protein